jgi:hypothetical protein
MQIRLEAGDTGIFTMVTSAALDGPPTLVVYDPGNTAVASITSVASSTTSFWALFVAPNSGPYGQYLADWRGLKTVAGSAYPLRDREPFIVAKAAE